MFPFQTRKKLKELPDLKCAEVAAAAVKIQKVYRGFQTRKQMEDDLPNLKCAKVAHATIKIQKVFRGYQTRKQLEMAQTAAAAVKIQKVFRGFKVRIEAQYTFFYCSPIILYNFCTEKLLTSSYPTTF